MERPSVQAPDTFYPEAVSHNTIAMEKPQGVIFTASLTFPAVKGLHPTRLSGLPLFPQRSGKNTEKRLIPLFSFPFLSAMPFIFPAQPLPAFSSAAFAAPLHHGRKNRTSRKKRHTSAQSGINSRAFVRLFLTLGKNTLDSLSRINK